MASKGDAVATIREALGATRSRAETIAVTETHKLAAQLTQARHEAAGITRFRWSTSHDARVRPSHRVLHGREFDYDDPPIVDGEPTLPGHAPRCRCVPIPIPPPLE
jgi:SPP1 gp7 family putative phage head morphogenesis protein